LPYAASIYIYIYLHLYLYIYACVSIPDEPEKAWEPLAPVALGEGRVPTHLGWGPREGLLAVSIYTYICTCINMHMYVYIYMYMVYV